MAIQQDKPALPPRPTEFIGCAKTPSAWLVALTRHPEKNHSHDFHISPVLEEDGNATGIICKTCHKRFKFTIYENHDMMNVEQGMCTANNATSLHHLHTDEATESHVFSRCCLCQFTVNVEIIEPIIGTTILNELSRNMSYNVTIECLSSIVSDFLSSEEHRPLNIDGRSFSERIGLSEASQAFFQKLGYTMKDRQDNQDRPEKVYQPPELNEETRARFKYVSEELDMKFLGLGLDKELLNSETKKRPWNKLSSILGIEYKKQATSFNYGPFDPSSLFPSSHCSTLGCTSDMDDSILVWAYNLAIEENPEKTHIYLQAVFDLINGDRKTETLEELLAVERSKGKFSVNDLNDAYNEMTASQNVPDEMLIEAYRTYVSDNPSKRIKLFDALTIIGKHRRSSKIENFLREDSNPYAPQVNMFNHFSDMPVGLDNIGNTCYLNSLLQYYFTIRDLREAVFVSDSVSTNGLDQWGETVTIGGRKVTKAEVERANRFVTHLRNLFVELMHSSHTSITPNSDLAYLALVNAKSDEEQPKESSRSPMDTTANSVDMQVDDSSPGPSSNRVNDPSDLIDFRHNEMEETETVILSGTAPPSSTAEPFFQTADTFMNDENSFTPFHKGKERENNHSDEHDSKEDKLKKASGMLFGKQQDVTECMDNVMFQLEAALKSTVDVDKQNIVRSLFYGNSRQILRYTDPDTGETVRKIKEEPFNHLLVVVAEGRDLYDGLDVYFDTSTVDFNGTQAEREITLLTSPPILQIQVQRVQFDRSTSNIYKSNAYLRFEETIFLDRYLDKNRELLRDRIAQAHSWKQEIDSLQEETERLSCDKTTSLPIFDLLGSTVEFVQSMKYEDPEFVMDENTDRRLGELRRERDQISSKISESEYKINSLRSQLKEQYADLRECKYSLHAVFIHSGQATFGHYWIYIYDSEKDRWLKYNDSYVTEVTKREVFADTTGSSANPYCMVYVRTEGTNQLVDTVCRKSNI